MDVRTALLPVFALLLGSTVGCSILQDQPAMPLTDDAATMAAASDPQVVVELKREKHETEYLRAPLKESMLVQDALKGSGAIQRFRRMDIVLVRQTPQGEKLRLNVQYNPSTRRVVDENNYALHGGDWLEVTEDTSTALDRFVESAMTPLRPMMRSYRD